MEHRTIGDFKVSLLGLGTSRLASLGAHGSVRLAARMLDEAADLGISFIDTADTFGSTACERWLGEVMQKRSQRFVISTKFGLPAVDLPPPLRGFNQPAKKVVKLLGPQHYLDPAYVSRSIDSSLRRLRRDILEIYLIHKPPPGVEQMEDLFAVLDDARAAGKIGSYGICSKETGIIRAAALVGRSDVWHTPSDPPATERLLSAINSVGRPDKVDLIAHHVLSGCLTTPSPDARIPPSVAIPLGKKLDAMCAERGVSRAHLLIRHAAALPNTRVVLTNTANPAHLAENAAALNEPVTEEDLLTC